MRTRGTADLRAAALLLILASVSYAQVSITGKVVDENGVAVAGARVELRPQAGGSPVTASADPAGLFSFTLEKSGEYRIDCQRLGFFRFTSNTTFRDGANDLTVTLNHLQEFAESVDVVYSPPAIELDQPVERKELNTVEILTVPYPAPHDLRNALPLFNGVVQDTAGRAHVNGGASEQTNYSLDGFNISDPVTGRFEARLNIDSVQSLDLQTSRFGADKGRASAGTLDVRTKMGDDRWRFGGTNFIPGISTDQGLHVNKWTPRLEVSGPLARSRAWFHNGFDAFYDVDTIHGLPPDGNRARSLTTSNLSRFQVNLTPANILTATFLVNYTDARHNGLSFLNPTETTTNRRQTLFMSAVRDQVYLGGGTLLDFGFADTRIGYRQLPQGVRLYEITPNGARGNYFVNMDRHSYRQQWTVNAILPAVQAAGSHQFKVGVDFERESFHQEVRRHDYQVLRADQSVARYVTFSGSPFQRRGNFEGAQYALDRWTPREGITIEAGLRADWDQVVRDVLWSPRVSAAWAPGPGRDLKLAAGYGVFYDPLTLGVLALHQDQVSFSTFFRPDGVSAGAPVETAFFADERSLHVPRYRTASFSAERKLPFELFARAAYTRRTGSAGFTLVNEQSGLPATEAGGYYMLRNWKHDRYRAMELSLRRTFGRFEWSAGYTRSTARTDAAVEYSLENPIFGPQGPGPVAWDAPHRFLMWGWLPIPRRMLPGWVAAIVRETDAAYLVEYRTGFPFSVVSDEGLMVGPPNSRRLPGYFNINLHFERKFRALHYLWAWRFGFNNLTNNGNPNTVNNNVDSPTYLAYGRGQARAFTVRLRLLGRK